MSYKKGEVLSQFQHAYKRPDTYIGSVTTILDSKWVAKEEISFEKIRYNPGLSNIFRELGSNIIDNKWRSENDPDSPPMKKVVIKTDLETGEISFWNDGYCIPVHKESYTFEPFKKEPYILQKSSLVRWEQGPILMIQKREKHLGGMAWVRSL